jgi:hypothetical protein
MPLDAGEEDRCTVHSSDEKKNLSAPDPAADSVVSGPGNGSRLARQGIQALKNINAFLSYLLLS